MVGAFKQAPGMLRAYPKTLAALLRISRRQAHASRLRNEWLEKGVAVPAYLIVSTTDDCNLQCKGCYSQDLRCDQGTQNVLPAKRVEELVREAFALGCSAFLLAGGEPLMAPVWMNAVARQKTMLGLVFTNGTLINEEWLDFFDARRNMIALFSLEGSAESTELRRGKGVVEKIKSGMLAMRRRKIPFGISVTTGEHNLAEVMQARFVEEYYDLGCRLVFYVEYVPTGDATGFLPLSEKEKLELADYCGVMTETSGVIHISFPGDESVFGGCLAAGRGFLHVSTSGSLEPCPFAPYSDSSLANKSLLEAIQSPLLAAVRAEAHTLREGIGGCSLREKEDWLKELTT